MNSIKSIKLENFQSYINTTIRPAPNGELSVVTGASDSGKTAILRALRWVFFNTPSGTDFIRVGATFARITVEFESGDTIIRWRSTGSINRYMVNGETYEGFGANVPFEVSHVSGISPVSIGDLNINLNLAEQLDGPFLGKSISAGARAKVLGKLAGTEEIDFAAKQLGTDLYRRNQDEKRLAGEVAGLEESIKEFDWLPETARNIEALEGLAAGIRTARERLMQLETKKAQYNEIQENIYECLAILERWRGLERAADLSGQVKGAHALQGRLTKLKEQAAQVKERIIAAQGVLYRCRNIEQVEILAVKADGDRRDKKVLASLLDSFWAYQKTIRANEGLIERYAVLPDAETSLLAVQSVVEKIRRLQILKIKHLAVHATIKESQDVLIRLELLSAAEPLLHGVTTKNQRRMLLGNLSSKWTVANAAATGTQKRIDNLAGIDEAKIKVVSVSEKIERWTALSNAHAQYGQRRQAVSKVREQAVLWENRVAELEGAYHDMLDDVGICPLCGQEIKSKIREAV